MLQAIADTTENTRNALRGCPGWGDPVPMPPRGFSPAITRQREHTLADMVPWPALLTLDQSADDAAAQAGCSSRKEILDFALSICPIEHWFTLVNYMAHHASIASAAKVLSPVVRGLKAKEARIKQGASEGGKKSARARQKTSSTSDPAKLLQDRQRLLDAGRHTSEVAGILASRYGVTAATIRRKLNQAIKGQTG